jgi:hypothetical protein
MVGIDTAYENREVALLERDTKGEDAESFLRHVKDEPKLIVVGSSLLGLRMYMPRLAPYLRNRKERGHETRFLLTPPCFSALREDQEKRASGQIRGEVQDTLRFLENDAGLDLRECVRFYKGTPTCFMIVTSNAMLLNPYPYQTEAYKAFCLEVRRLERPGTHSLSSEAERADIAKVVDFQRFGPEIEIEMKKSDWGEYDYSHDVGPDIYGQFYWYHYFLPWFSKQAVTYEEYLRVCDQCQFHDVGISKDCKLRSPQGSGTGPTGHAESSHEEPIQKPCTPEASTDVKLREDP